jgi:hypothetical protein
MNMNVQKATALSNRIRPIILAPEVQQEIATEQKVQRKRVEKYYQEWLFEMADSARNDDYFLATRNPREQFSRWVSARIADPFFVAKSIRNILSQRFHVDIANKIFMIIWPQEIAWAQRYRLDANAYNATKAALFLSQAQDDTKSVFLSIADLHAEAFMNFDYNRSHFQDMSPEEIRNSPELPDFTPLFLTHANRNYIDKLSKLNSGDFHKYAGVAAQLEKNERQSVMRLQLIDHARRHPLRRSLPVLAAARAHKIDSNELYLLEQYFLDLLEKKAIEVVPGSSTALPLFTAFISDRRGIKRTILEAATFAGPDAKAIDQLGVLGLRNWWIDQLPDGYRNLGNIITRFSEWREALIDDTRKMPFDPVSDFGYFLLERADLLS